jgi:hypothetical protein
MTCGKRVKVKLSVFLTSTLHKYERLASLSGRFNLGTQLIVGCVNLTAGLDVGPLRIPAPERFWIPVIKTAVSHITDWYVLAKYSPFKIVFAGSAGIRILSLFAALKLTFCHSSYAWCKLITCYAKFHSHYHHHDLLATSIFGTSTARNPRVLDFFI